MTRSLPLHFLYIILLVPLFSWGQSLELGLKANDQYSGVNLHKGFAFGLAGELTAYFNRAREWRGTIQVQKSNRLLLTRRLRGPKVFWYYGAAARMSSSKMLEKKELNYGVDAVFGLNAKGPVLPLSFSAEYLPGYSKNSMYSGMEFNNWALSCRYIF